MRQLKVLELFSGTGSISNAFERHGHKTFRVDWDTKFQANWYVDIEKVKASEVVKRFGYPDVVWMSPDCSSYSVAAISRHRRKNSDTGALDPISDYARKCDRVNLNCMRLLRDLRPPLFFIENPRAGMRKMPWLQIVPINTITYCQYMTKLPLEQRRMKPTDLFSNHPNPEFAPPLQERRPLSCEGAKRLDNGNAGHEGG